MTKALKRGDVGPAVREAQGNLRAAGVAVKVDGVFGPDTDAATRTFQKARGLQVDGKVGRLTWAALHRTSAAHPPGGGFDPFDASDYADWLRGKYDAWFAQEERRAVPARAVRPATPPARAPERPTPRPVAPRGPSQPRPGIISQTQNKKHSRIAFPGYEGKGYVLNDFLKLEGWEVKLVGGHMVRPHTGKIKNECAQLVQLFGVPHTSAWRRGPQVCHMAPGTLPVGAVVATLRNNKYYSDYSGRSHVGIYLGHDPYIRAEGNGNAGGVRLLDQYNGARIEARTKAYSTIVGTTKIKSKKAWTDSDGDRQTHRVNWIKDGEEYFVLMTHL